MTCGGAGGKGTWAKTGKVPDDIKPEEVNFFSKGNNTEGGIVDIEEGEEEDTAASNMSKAIGDNSFSTHGDDDIVLNRVRSVDDGKTLESWGVVDNVFTIVTSVEGGKWWSVDDVHRLVSKATTDEEDSGNNWFALVELMYCFVPACKLGTTQVPFEL